MFNPLHQKTMFSGDIERDQWHTVGHCGVMETDHVDQHRHFKF